MDIYLEKRNVAIHGAGGNWPTITKSNEPAYLVKKKVNIYNN